MVKDRCLYSDYTLCDSRSWWSLRIIGLGFTLGLELVFNTHVSPSGDNLLAKCRGGCSLVTNPRNILSQC